MRRFNRSLLVSIVAVSGCLGGCLAPAEAPVEALRSAEIVPDGIPIGPSPKNAEQALDTFDTRAQAFLRFAACQRSEMSDHLFGDSLQDFADNALALLAYRGACWNDSRPVTD